MLYLTLSLQYWRSVLAEMVCWTLFRREQKRSYKVVFGHCHRPGRGVLGVSLASVQKEEKLGLSSFLESLQAYLRHIEFFENFGKVNFLRNIEAFSRGQGHGSWNYVGFLLHLGFFAAIQHCPPGSPVQWNAQWQPPVSTNDMLTVLPNPAHICARCVGILRPPPFQ